MNTLLRVFAVVAVAGAAGRGLSAGEIGHLPTADRAHLLEDHFRIVKKVADLPTGVITAFAEHTKQSPFRMADPGEEFQVTDEVIKPHLPVRRLVFAGISDGYCVIQYESGGIAHLWWVVLFRLSSSGPAKVVWAASAPKWGGFATLSDLREAVRKGELRDDPRDSW